MSPRLSGHCVATFAGVLKKKLVPCSLAAALGLIAFGTANTSVAGTSFVGQFGTSNSWNVYEAINTSFTLEEALAIAATRPNPLAGNTAVGHLVTLTSQTENNFVQTNAGGNRWIGLSDRVGVAPMAMESAFLGDPLTQGWKWVTGEPFSFQAWGGGEPNNAGAGEDAVHLRGDNLWNDNASGFGQDEPVPDLDSTAEPATAFPFVIEWSTNLATMPTGFPMTRPDPPAPTIPRVYPTPLARMLGNNGTATAFGVLDVRDIGNSASLQQAIADIQGGAGTRTNGTAARFDINDPDNGGNQGSVLGPQVPTPSDVPGTDDNGIQSVVKGTFSVPAGQGGAYTFNVRSDDGFGLRILSQPSGGSLTQHKFTNVRGNGRVDEDGSLVHVAPTGDSNTQGVITLAPGTYDAEFVVYEDGGGAFWEVSTQKGDFLDPPPNTAANWILLGDGASKTQEGPFPQVARLTGNATVRNSAFSDNIANTVGLWRSNPVPDAQGTVDEVILYDGDDICCGRPGVGLPAAQINEFPNMGNDNFTTMVNGTLQVLDTNGAPGETMTIGLFADDNAAVHLIGQDFTTAGGGGALVDVEGNGDQWLVADFRTGNTDAFGVITLPEGNYNFEAFQLEEGGDSGLEVWVAAGNRIGFNSAFFFPLDTETLGSNIILAANQGLPLVLGPGTGPSGPGAQIGDFNGNGVVDAADYVLWRNGSPLQNEGGVTPGTATPEDYQTWRANFGRAAGAAAANAAVPEATTLLSAAIAVLLGFVSTRARRS